MSEAAEDVKIASLAPAQLWPVTFFTSRLLVLFLAFLVSLFVLRDYLLDPRQSYWMLVNIFAIGFVVVGLGKASLEIARIRIENALIAVAEEASEDYLHGANKNVRDDLTDLKARLTVENRSNPVVHRLLDHVISDAMSNRFDARINLVQPYKDESLDIVFSIQSYQKLTLWIGIAGTFIGILHAMQSSSFLQFQTSSKPEDFVQLVPMMFDGLVISFGASLAGLLAAVFLGWIVLIVRKMQASTFKRLEHLASVVTLCARKSKNKESYLTEIDQFREDLSTNQQQTKTLQRAILELQQKISSQHEQLTQSIMKFWESNVKMFDAAERADATLKKIVYDGATLRTAVENSIKIAAESISTSMNTPLTVFNRDLERLNTSVGALDRSMSAHTSELRATESKGIDGIHALSRNVAEVSNAVRLIRRADFSSYWIIGGSLVVGVVIGVTIAILR
jgi:predicted  nucleic acid-binding Zn-ribbon protein